MTARENFLKLMAERRRFKPGSIDHQWMTRACRTYVWMMRGVPSQEWAHG